MTPGSAVTSWRFDPLALILMSALAAGYLAGTWAVRRRHPARPWPWPRTLAFLAGLAVTVIATESAADVYASVLFSAHMVQHLLLIMVAPPLLVAGRPVTLLLHAVRNPAHTWVKRVLRSRAVSGLTWPPAVTLAYAAVVAGTHMPPAVSLVTGDGAAHLAEHGLYLASGYLFFLLVTGSEPVGRRISRPARYLMLLAGMQVDTVTGVVLMVTGHEPFPAYASPRRAWGPPPLTDIHDGGMIMWIGSDIVMTVLAVCVCAAFIHDPRAAGHVGGWAEGIRRRVLARNLTAAGLAVPPTAGGGGGRGRSTPSGTVDDDAHLAAYNTYLTALDTGGWPGAPGPSSAPGAPAPPG